MKRYISFLFILLALSVNAFAQKVSVDVAIDSVQLFVGEQTAYHLGVTIKDKQKIDFPPIRERSVLTPGVEVVEVLGCDTEQIDDQFIKVSMHYLLTSFEDTLYRIPPIPVKVDGKTYESKAVALKVLTIPVDTLHPNQFYPPKDVQDNPFLWREWSSMLWLTLLILMLYGLAILLFIRLKSNKPIVLSVRIIKLIPPHQKALNSIEEIKTHKTTYTADDAKQYYTQLTDTLRRYMNERFGFNAMEMTSAEIIDRLRSEDDQQKINELTMLFETADLVKFAKHSTNASENDRNLLSAIDFINTTKKEIVTEERVRPTATEAQKQMVRTRISLKWTICAVILIATAIMVYVIWHLITLLS